MSEGRDFSPRKKKKSKRHLVTSGEDKSLFGKIKDNIGVYSKGRKGFWGGGRILMGYRSKNPLKAQEGRGQVTGIEMQQD